MTILGRVNKQLVSLHQAIERNRRRHKYRKMVRRLLLVRFEWEDAGETEKYERVLNRARGLAK